jgi:hypothetical protein
MVVSLRKALDMMIAAMSTQPASPARANQNRGEECSFTLHFPGATAVRAAATGMLDSDQIPRAARGVSLAAVFPSERIRARLARQGGHHGATDTYTRSRI